MTNTAYFDNSNATTIYSANTNHSTTSATHSGKQAARLWAHLKYTFHALTADEISCDEGDLVLVLAQSRDWFLVQYYGEDTTQVHPVDIWTDDGSSGGNSPSAIATGKSAKRRGSIGLIPVCYVEFISYTLVCIDPSLSDNPLSPSSPHSMKSIGSYKSYGSHGSGTDPWSRVDYASILLKEKHSSSMSRWIRIPGVREWKLRILQIIHKNGWTQFLYSPSTSLHPESASRHGKKSPTKSKLAQKGLKIKTAPNDGVPPPRKLSNGSLPNPASAASASSNTTASSGSLQVGTTVLTSNGYSWSDEESYTHVYNTYPSPSAASMGSICSPTKSVASVGSNWSRGDESDGGRSQLLSPISETSAVSFDHVSSGQITHPAQSQPQHHQWKVRVPKYLKPARSSSSSSKHSESKYIFVIEVQPPASAAHSSKRYTIYKRYEDFYTLHRTLLKEFPHLAGKSNPHERLIPFFPAPVQQVTSAIMKKRRFDIDMYMRRLMVLPEEVTKGDTVMTFLQSGFREEMGIKLNAVPEEQEGSIGSGGEMPGTSRERRKRAGSSPQLSVKQNSPVEMKPKSKWKMSSNKESSGDGASKDGDAVPWMPNRSSGGSNSAKKKQVPASSSSPQPLFYY